MLRKSWRLAVLLAVLVLLTSLAVGGAVAAGNGKDKSKPKDKPGSGQVSKPTGRPIHAIGTFVSFDSATNKLTVAPKKGGDNVVFLVTSETRIVGPGVTQGTPSLLAGLTKESRLNVTGRTDRATNTSTARLVVIQAPKKPKTKAD
jgi:hypothetical protein